MGLIGIDYFNMAKINPTTIKERLTAVEVKIEKLQEEFDDFRSNDFKHLKSRVDWILGLLFTLLLSILIIALKLLAL